MVISTSLALGIIIGFVIVQMFGSVFWRCLSCGTKTPEEQNLAIERLAGMYSAPAVKQDDKSLLSQSNRQELRESSSDEEEKLAEDLRTQVDAYFPVRLDGDTIDANDVENVDNQEKGEITSNTME